MKITKKVENHEFHTLEILRLISDERLDLNQSKTFSKSEYKLHMFVYEIKMNL